MPPRIATPATGLREDLFDLRALARNAGDSLAGARLRAKGLQSRVDISAGLPSLVVGDPVRLRAALENLIDNAVKFTEQGGRRAEGRARLPPPKETPRENAKGNKGRGRSCVLRSPTAGSA